MIKLVKFEANKKTYPRLQKNSTLHPPHIQNYLTIKYIHIPYYESITNKLY